MHFHLKFCSKTISTTRHRTIVLLIRQICYSMFWTNAFETRSVPFSSKSETTSKPTCVWYWTGQWRIIWLL